MSVERAAALLELRRYDDVLALLGQMDAADDASASCIRAVALLETGRLDEAWVAARRAVGQAPDEAQGRRVAAVVRLRQHRNRSALEHALEAVRLEPDEASGHHLAGLALLLLGDIERASAHVGAMASLAPDLPETHVLRARLLAARGDLGHAARAARHALALDPTDADAMECLAGIETARGDHALATALRLAAARSDATDPARRRSLLGRAGVLTAGSFTGLKVLTLLKIGYVFAFLGFHRGLVTGHAAAVGSLCAAGYAAAYASTSAVRRIRGRSLPPAVWDALADHRRNATLLWTGVPAAAVLLLTPVYVLQGLVRGLDLSGVVPVVVVATVALLGSWFLRRGDARALRPRDVVRRVTAFVRVVSDRWRTSREVRRRGRAVPGAQLP